MIARSDKPYNSLYGFMLNMYPQNSHWEFKFRHVLIWRYVKYLPPKFQSEIADHLQVCVCFKWNSYARHKKNLNMQ